MIKNRTAQLILQSVFIALGLISVLASFGLFTIEEGFHTDWYVHFTNLSNYLCIGIMFCELIQTIKKKEDGFVTAVPTLKFIVLLMITFTFLVFNIMLAPARKAYLNYRINSVLFHIVLPLMFIADWVLFYEKRTIRWFGYFYGKEDDGFRYVRKCERHKLSYAVSEYPKRRSMK